MLTEYQAYRRLLAFSEGKPLSRGTTLHFPIAAGTDALIVAFVKMGGESAPWGIAWGAPGGRPQIEVTPEPRDRDGVADLAMRFAPVLLEHLCHPEFFEDGDFDGRNPPPAHQVWLPNPTHVEMLHYLDFAYTRTRARSAAERHLLQALGRAAGWLFRESRRPGQTTLMAATDALRSSFTFPAEDVRLAHLGYLLAWLETKGEREARIAKATEAEAHSIATALDPELERGKLEPLVTAYNEAEKTGDTRAQGKAERSIEGVLRAELEHRFDLVGRSLARLHRDPRKVNPGVENLVEASRLEHWYQYLRRERDQVDWGDGPTFTPGPETDHHPASAGSRYFVFEDSQAVYDSVLVHHDSDLQAEAIAEGRAARGRIVEVWDEGEGKKTRPVWVVAGSGPPPVRLREGSGLCVAGLPKRTLEVRSIEDSKAGGWRLEVALTACLTVPRDRPGGLHGADPKHEGTTVTLLPKVISGISRLKSQKVWRKDQPGSWLTRSVPKRTIDAADPESGREVREVDQAIREQM